MGMHKLLQRQLKKYLPDSKMDAASLAAFIEAVNDSYNSFEKNHEFANHVSTLSEKEFIKSNLKLEQEDAKKRISIEKLNEILVGVEDYDHSIESASAGDDLLVIVEKVKVLITRARTDATELKKNIKSITTLISNLHSGVLVEDQDRKIVFTNQTFCDMFGILVKPESLMGSAFPNEAEQSKHLFANPDSIIHDIQSLIKSKSTVKGDVLWLMDGRVFERDFIPIYVEGQYTGHLWNYTDTTEKRKIIEAIAESESRNKLIMNSALDAIITINDKGYINFWNKQAEIIFGWNESEVLNKKLSDFILPERFKIAHDQDLEYYRTTGEGYMLNKLIEIVGVNKLEEEFPIELSVIPINLGDKVIFCSFIRNISSRKKAQQNLISSELKYRNIISSMSLGLLEVDRNDRIQYANESFGKMCGYDVNEIIGHRATDLFVVKENRSLVEEKNIIRRSGVTDSYELYINTKKGETRCWLVSGGPRYNENREVIGSIGIHLDITDQKTVQSQLVIAREKAEHSAIAKEAFLANMSHEIRTPLNGIVGMLRELTKVSSSPQQIEYLDNAKKASKHLLSIINNILDISKIEAGELNLEFHHFNLEQVINDVLQILKGQAILNSIELIKKMDPNLHHVFIGDAARIKQILINLAGNAIKFSENEKVIIQCESANLTDKTQEVIFRVIDHGIGMGADYLKKIFTRFQQEGDTNNQNSGGSGLGLIITKELVNAMQGDINIKSKKGKGTEVIVRLSFPLGETEVPEEEFKILGLETLTNKSILLVEDNEMNRFVVLNSLLPYNINITEAVNGEVAINILKTQKFDLILMDLQMPIMGGVEATRMIREQLKLETPIIALTANAIKTEINNCLQAGMNNYIMKPFEEHDLLHVILKELGPNSNLPNSDKPEND